MAPRSLLLRILLRATLRALAALLALGVVGVVYGSLPNRWYHLLPITSGSMAPTLRPGDLILITPPAVLRPRMIVTLAVNGSLVTHRLVGFGEYGEPVTQGDANLTADDWRGAPARVVGVVRARIPWLGYVAVLAGRWTRAAGSGAWFADAEMIEGELTTGADWLPPEALPPDLRGSLSAGAAFRDGQARADLSLCLANTGAARVDGLNIHARIQAAQAPGDYFDLANGPVDTGARPGLEPGEEYCYSAYALFSPPPGAAYRAVVTVVVAGLPARDQAAGDAEPAVVLELSQDFDLADLPTPSEPAGPETATPPAWTETATFTPSGAPTEPPTSTPAIPPADSPAPTLTLPPADPPTPAELTLTPAPTGTPPNGETLGPTGTPEAPGAEGARLAIEVTAAGWLRPDEPAPYGVGGDVCVANLGPATAEGLAAAAQVQFVVAGGLAVDLVEAQQVVAAASSLAPGARECYPISIAFAPLPGAVYQLAAAVTSLNHPGWLPGGALCPGPDPCRYGPTAKTDFHLP